MIFHPIGLLSKWGFCDGDIMEEFATDHSIDLPYTEFGFSISHRILIEVVEKHLLPQLHQQVVIVTINCIHNPIRASTVDGKDVEHLWTNNKCPIDIITPASVDIPDETLLAIVKKHIDL